MKFAIAAVLSGLLVSGATANFFTLSYSESTGYCSVVLTDVCSCTEKVEFYKKGKSALLRYINPATLVLTRVVT